MGGGYRLADYIGGSARYSLIALAVVVRTYVEMGMGVALIPFQLTVAVDSWQLAALSWFAFFIPYGIITG